MNALLSIQGKLVADLTAPASSASVEPPWFSGPALGGGSSDGIGSGPGGIPIISGGGK